MPVSHSFAVRGPSLGNGARSRRERGAWCRSRGLGYNGVMSEDLREAMLGRMSALCSGIAALSRTADELARSAHLLEGGPVAERMRGHARRQRIRVLEMQGRLAALSHAYTKRFDADPWTPA